MITYAVDYRRVLPRLVLINEYYMLRHASPDEETGVRVNSVCFNISDFQLRHSSASNVP